MAGAALGALRLLGAPGVPRLAGTGMGPVASSQLPLSRRRTSGQPRSQRALKRNVAVWPAASEVLVRAHCAEFAPVQIRSVQRRWRERALAKPAGSRLE